MGNRDVVQPRAGDRLAGFIAGQGADRRARHGCRVAQKRIRRCRVVVSQYANASSVEQPQLRIEVRKAAMFEARNGGGAEMRGIVNPNEIHVLEVVLGTQEARRYRDFDRAFDHMQSRAHRGLRAARQAPSIAMLAFDPIRTRERGQCHANRHGRAQKYPVK